MKWVTATTDNPVDESHTDLTEWASSLEHMGANLPVFACVLLITRTLLTLVTRRSGLRLHGMWEAEGRILEGAQRAEGLAAISDQGVCGCRGVGVGITVWAGGGAMCVAVIVPGGLQWLSDLSGHGFTHVFHTWANFSCDQPSMESHRKFWEMQ